MNWYPVVLNGSGMKALWAAEIMAHKGAEGAVALSGDGSGRGGFLQAVSIPD